MLLIRKAILVFKCVKLYQNYKYIFNCFLAEHDPFYNNKNNQILNFKKTNKLKF
jgi:hypothetical protein